MARLVWNAFGTRRYETGVDRGVLFANSQAGVPWNGLISVVEKPTGGKTQEYYIDGFKYANVMSSEDFEAEITAFSAPMEFDAADGYAELSNGLFVSQQPRKPFAFSYRTRVGNDLSGIDHGYKIHIVYNATAESNERTYETLGDKVAPDALSWTITTRPPYISGFRPTSHFVIDSLRTSPDLLLTIEDRLYGSVTQESNVPTPSTLIEMFANGEP